MNLEAAAPYIGIGTSFLTGGKSQAPTPPAPPSGTGAQPSLIQGAGAVPQNQPSQNPAALASIVQALMGGKAGGAPGMPGAPGAMGGPSPMGALFSKPPMPDPGMGLG